MPWLYLHAMAMPLHMAIMSHPAFPLRLQSGSEGNSTRFVLKVPPTGEPHIEGFIRSTIDSKK